MSKTVVTPHGTLIWYNEFGQIHRGNDLPAVIDANGDQEWFVNDRKHRENNLPAAVCTDGRKFWYKDGIRIKWE